MNSNKEQKKKVCGSPKEKKGERERGRGEKPKKYYESRDNKKK